MTKKTDIQLETVVRKYIPCLSSQLAGCVAKECGITQIAARKRISRAVASGQLSMLRGLPFPRRVNFLYKQTDIGTDVYWKRLKEAILETSSTYSVALSSIIQRGGIVRRSDFLISCGAPVRQRKHLSSEDVISRFTTVGVLSELDIPGLGKCLLVADSLLQSDSTLVPRLRARLVSESILLKAIKDWVRKLGFVSYDKVLLRDEGMQPQVGTYAWDLTGPSYLAPLIEWGSGGSKPKPGFVVCDVLLGHEIDEQGILPFIQKCNTLRSLKNIGRCIQIFVAESYSPEALRIAKSNGIVPATPETLFGTEISNCLKKLTELLSQNAIASLRPEIFNDLFDGLGKIEGAATNLRGALFEYFAAELARQKIGNNTSLNIIFKNQGEEAEIDVVSVHSNASVHFIECKGYQPNGTLEDADVERWLTKTVPFVYHEAIVDPRWKDKEIYFELWITGKATQEVVAKITAAAKKTKKYAIIFRDAESVYSFAKTTRDKSLIKTFEQHFRNHPLATAEKRVEKRTKKYK